MERLLDWTFGVAALIVMGELVLAMLLTHTIPFAGFLIFGAMLLCFWAIGRTGKASWHALLSGLLLVLLCSSATLFGWWGWSLAGVTFDTYIHLLSGFVTMLLLLEALREKRHGLLVAVAIVAVLSLGVEIAEVADELWFSSEPLLTQECARAFCSYWQDTVKDLVNDALGAGLAFLGWSAARRVTAVRRGARALTARRRRRRGTRR